MKRIGWAEARVLFVDDDNITATRRALADNRTAELAEWDDEVLSNLLSEVGDDIPGWTDEEIHKLIDDSIPEEEPEYDESVANDVKKVTCPECGHEFPV
jgi:ParB-like chromosome segregation protein Spo0J